MEFKAGSIIATLKADIKGFQANIKKATDSVKGHTRDAGGFLSRAGDFFTKYKVKILAVVAAVSAVGFSFKKMADAASDAEEAANKVVLAFGDSAGLINQFAEQSAKNFGISKTEFQDLSGTLGIMATNMGLTQEQAAKMSISMIQAAADMGSAFNRDPIQVVQDMRSALAGSTETLQKYGIRLNETAIQNKALEMGLISGKEKVDDYARAMAIQAVVMEKSKSVAGDFKRTSDGLANATRIMTAQFKDLTAQLGVYVLPMFTAITAVVNKFLETANSLAKVAEETKGRFIIAFLGIEQSVLKSIGIAKQFLASALQDMLNITVELLAMIKKFWIEHGDAVMTIISTIGVAFAAGLKAMLVIAREILLPLLSLFVTIFGQLLEITAATIDFIVSLFTMNYDNIYNAALNAAGAIQIAFAVIMNKALEIVTEGMNRIIGAINELGIFIRKVFPNVGKAMAELGRVSFVPFDVGSLAKDTQKAELSISSMVANMKSSLSDLSGIDLGLGDLGSGFGGGSSGGGGSGGSGGSKEKGLHAWEMDEGFDRAKAREIARARTLAKFRRVVENRAEMRELYGVADLSEGVNYRGVVININDSMITDEESARDLLEKAFNAMNLAT